MWMPSDKCAYFTENFPNVCPSDPKSEFQQFHGMRCVPIGWFYRLVGMCAALETIGVPVQLTQVKQDCGELRAHTDDISNAVVNAIVHSAEKDCSELCAICGHKVPPSRMPRIHGIGRVCGEDCYTKYIDEG